MELMGTHHYIARLYRLRGAEQVLMPLHQVLHSLSHLPSPLLIFKIMFEIGTNFNVANKKMNF